MTPIKLKVAEKLAKIARKPDHSPRTMLILTQRTVRISLAKLAEIRAERRVFRREAAALQGYPYTQQQMDKLFEKSRTHRDDDIRDIKQGLIGMGYHQQLRRNWIRQLMRPAEHQSDTPPGDSERRARAGRPDLRRPA